MMDWTDRHFRYFARLLSRHTLLYTEMVTTGALIYGDRARFLRYGPAEHPVALQLGGSDPPALSQCAHLGADWGYDEINLNVGCPSDRVQNGRFGACLMAEPALVAECVAGMKQAAEVPVTVKCRIGIDDRDSYPELVAFAAEVAAAGCDALIVHARKAWLKGLSPRENREVPPLRWDWVTALKRDFPALPIVLNGGVTRLDQAEQLLGEVDGVMIGREAYQSPWLLADVDRRLFGAPNPVSTPQQALSMYQPYVAAQLEEGVPLASMARHLLGLFHGQPGAKAWRRTLSERAHLRGAGIDVLDAAAECVAIRAPALTEA